MADVELPQLGETVTEGTITQWFKSVGDEVAQDEPLFEVSTDKVDSEVPAPSSGYLAEILVEEGETVDVGTKLAVISDAPPDGAEAKGDDSADEEEPAESEDEDEPEPEPEADDGAPVEDPEAPPEERGAGKDSADTEEEPEAEEGEKAEKDEEPPPEKQSAGGDGDGKGKLLSPVVRRLVTKHNLDPDQIEGTGAGGRITRKDVMRVAESGQRGGAAPAKEDAGQRPAPAVPVAKAGHRDRVVPLSNIRRRTGEHMVGSKAVAPHVLTAMEVDYEGVDRVRRAHRDRWKKEEGFSLTYLPFIARAVVDALDEFPFINASVGDGELVVHEDVNMAIAVDLDFQGLLAPVIRGAQDKRLPAIAREIRDLADRARSKKLSADEIVGGTFTITNPGQYGTMMQFPVINQPQVAILSTDGVARKPVVVTDEKGSEAIAIHSVGVLALAWDHRAFDGAYAAAFLAELRDTIEGRDWQSEL